MFKKNFKSVVFAAMLATAGFMGSAQAASFDLYSDGSGGFSGTATNGFGSAVGAFDDHFLFTLSTPFTSAASVTSSFTKLGGNVKDLTITGFNLIQYGANENNILFKVTGYNDLATSGAGTNDLWKLDTVNLSAGNYYLEVTGMVTGNKGGSYAADVQVLAVPEPETYAMLAAGLGLIGFASRRKAKKAA
jgi:hypothetical protein